MAKMHDTTFPNCRCNHKIVMVRVSGGAPDKDAEAEDGEGVTDVLAMGSVKVTDTKLLELSLLRRWYVC
jgi:hypothetical protein